jgi:hypothetical protein
LTPAVIVSASADASRVRRVSAMLFSDLSYTGGNEASGVPVPKS